MDMESLAGAFFPFEWRVACGGLEFLDEVVRGAEAGAGGYLLEVEVGFKEQALCFCEAAEVWHATKLEWILTHGTVERRPETREMVYA